MERARLALDVLDDPNFDYMRVYVQNAYAVLVVPDAQGRVLPRGRIWDRRPSGARPADRQLGPAGVLLVVRRQRPRAQAGGIMSDMVFTIMNEGAVDKLIAHKVQFGDVGLAFGRMGVGVGAGTDSSARTCTRSPEQGQDLYGGVALEGTVVSPKHDWNGRTADARSIPRRSCARLRAAARRRRPAHGSRVLKQTALSCRPTNCSGRGWLRKPDSRPGSRLRVPVGLTRSSRRSSSGIDRACGDSV